MHPTVSVVVCAYTEERWDDLVSAVGSVTDQGHRPHEVVVVSDHNPSLLARAREGLSGITAVANEGARGLSGARNSGVAASTGEIVAFLDDDAAAEPGWLERLVAPYRDPRVVGVGGAALPVWETGRPSWFPEEFDWVVGCSYRGLPERASAVRNPIGANMSFRREILERVGGFESRLGRVGSSNGHCEETELGIRVAQQVPDGVVLYEPRAVVRHRVPRSRASWRYFRTRCYTEGIAKAAVSRLRGSAKGLASERVYTTRTLPRAVARGLGDAVRGRPGGAARAGAITLGLATTVAGYVSGRLPHLSPEART